MPAWADGVKVGGDVFRHVFMIGETGSAVASIERPRSKCHDPWTVTVRGGEAGDSSPANAGCSGWLAGRGVLDLLNGRSETVRSSSARRRHGTTTRGFSDRG